MEHGGDRGRRTARLPRSPGLPRPWDAVALQEGFRKLEGLDAGGHGVFTPPALLGGLRCPAIVVHRRWASEARYASGGARWIAVDVGTLTLVSIHLPHCRRTADDFAETLEELENFMASRPSRRIVIGADLNVPLTGTSDGDLIGPAVPIVDLPRRELERQGLVVEFLHKRGLRACNTWADTEFDALLWTREPWTGGTLSRRGQIDFVLASRGFWLQDAYVEQHIHATSDHKPVICTLRFRSAALRRHPAGGRQAGKAPVRCIKGWRPSATWHTEAARALDAWPTSWDEAATQLRDTAARCQELVANEHDEVLQSLLDEKRRLDGPIDERKQLSKRIWRRRRFLKRQKAEEELRQAALRGCAPKGPRPSIHLNWAKVLGKTGLTPSQLMTDYFSALYGLSPEDAQLAISAREKLMQAWLGSPMQPTKGLDAEGFKGAVKRLKGGKSSPDGVTAEMLRALPDEVMQAMADDVARRVRELDLPKEWFESSAALVAKVVGATDLSKFRPIACLAAMRKVLGYMFIAALPPLDWQTHQTAFVHGRHANMGTHLMLRLAEISREWKMPFSVGQLDLRKAFDHVDHRAVFRALQQQGVSPHAQALLAKAFSLSTLRAKLGGEQSDAVQLHRGLPQGAPESPLLFTMVVEMVIRKLEAKWRKRGAGFSLDGHSWRCVCYADDIVVLARTPKELQVMLAEVIAGFHEIGLGVGAEKTHWTSGPERLAHSITVEGHEIAWESTLTFVGVVLDFSGNSWAAMRHRMGRGMEVWRKWEPLLTAPWLAARRRADLLLTSVGASVLWGSGVWSTTKTQRQALDSWWARLHSSAMRLRRHPDEVIGHWWRRMHRTGHAAIQALGAPIAQCALLQAHRWGGHVARLEPEHFLSSAVRCRSMQWWRWKQSVHSSMHGAVHPRRFKLFRWEEQLCRAHGEGSAEAPTASTGWLGLAQDRSLWKAAENAFSKGEARFFC